MMVPFLLAATEVTVDERSRFLLAVLEEPDVVVEPDEVWLTGTLPAVCALTASGM